MKALQKLLKSVYWSKQIDVYKTLIANIHYDEQQKQEHQKEKLKNTLFIAKSIPFYQRALEGLDLENLEYNLFSQLPFLTKDAIKNNLDELKNKEYLKKHEVLVNSSGGSTGSTVKFFQTNEQRISGAGNYHFANYLNGIKPFDKTIIFWGALRDMHNNGRKSIYRRIVNYINISEILNTFVLSVPIIEKYIRIINEEKPKFIKAYVHSLYEIAKHINEKKIQINFSPIIQTSTGPLYPEIKEEIQRAFNNCHVFSFYGSREVSAIATEIPNEKDMVVLYDNVMVEIINENGEPVNENEEGEIVITTLNNHFMPLIRYKIGDRGVKGDSQDVFGTLRIKKVLGRTLGVIIKKDGKRIDGQFFTSFFFNKEGIKSFQLVQKNLDLLHLFIIRDENFNQDELDDVIKNIKSELDNIQIKIFFTDKINLGKTGKLMYVYSELEM